MMVCNVRVSRAVLRNFDHVIPFERPTGPFSARRHSYSLLAHLRPTRLLQPIDFYSYCYTIDPFPLAAMSPACRAPIVTTENFYQISQDKSANSDATNSRQVTKIASRPWCHGIGAEASHNLPNMSSKLSVVCRPCCP